MKEIEQRVSLLGERDVVDRQFILDLLLAYGRSSSNVARLASSAPSSLNVASDPSTEIAQKNTLYYKGFPDKDEDELLIEVESLSNSVSVTRFNIRFAIVTNLKLFVSKDVQTGEIRSFPISNIGENFTFFLPWAGMEKAQYSSESHADVKAASRMAKLFDELLSINPDVNFDRSQRHDLNVFFTRLLFCFFAEDTGIFKDNLFTNTLGSLTKVDGSDVANFLSQLFKALDTENAEDKPSHLRDFPYVNGKLFSTKSGFSIPQFNKKARDLLLESGKLKWSQINPDIFGSMFQAIVSPDQRSDLGQHYTSVPNILKTIEPLFLDELKDTFDASFDSIPKLKSLLSRISLIRVFDPACGSGNFLVIAYKELRKLEHAILERLGQITGRHQTVIGSEISIENFFGIEIDDFACEVAVLSLWIAKHQMNLEFKLKFGTDVPLIPLKEMGNISNANAARCDWFSVCPFSESTETYLIGNPPYAGSSMQSQEQKDDFEFAYRGREFSKNLDYISIWFIKGADYIRNTKAQLSFVTTNSVAQGEHVGLLFPTIFDMGIEIGYAYTSFKWENNAKRNAGVTVAVINLRHIQSRPKFLFIKNVRVEVKNINGYLADAPSTFLTRRSAPLQNLLPRMVRGSQPSDGGWLIFDKRKKTELEQSQPFRPNWIKRYVGSSEFINDRERYCLWITDSDAELAKGNPLLADLFKRVSKFREGRSDKATREFAETPWKFKQPAFKETDCVIVPSVSSERRDYIPMGYLDSSTVVSNAAYVIYDAEPWVFGLLTSKMHMVWARAVGGKMKTDYRYSNTIIYNNFPCPSLSDSSKELIEQAAFRILDVREYHSELNLADLYDPDKMPENLRLAHDQLDQVVESVFRKREFKSDEDRLSHLFSMFTSISGSLNGKDGLLELTYE